MAARTYRAVLLVSLASVLTLLTLAIPATAAAAPSEAQAVEKVTQLNRKALDAYAKQDWETARALLKEALELCASAGLDKHAIRARTHIHFGAVAITGFHQREVGLKQFRKALEVQPDIKLTKTIATPELQDAFEEAVLAGGGGGGDKTAGGDKTGGEGDKTAQGGDEPGVDAGEEGATPKPPKRPPPKRPGADEEEKDEYKGQKGVFFIAVTGGSGLGLIKGAGELDPAAHKLDAPGFALAQTAQVSPEVGFFISPDLLISAQIRIQYVGGLNGKAPRPVPGVQYPCGTDNFCTPGNGAVAGFAKLTMLLGDGPMHFTIGGQIGGGNIRHALEFPEDKTCMSGAGGATQSCVDTLAGGPFLIGPTAGLFYELGSAADFVLAVNTALGVPHFTFNFDFAAGIGFRI
jgi:hypothetical protein